MTGVVIPLYHYTPLELQLIGSCQTPADVQAYLSSLIYNSRGSDVKSFRRVVRTGNADCLEGALTAAAILEKHGYRPAVLDIIGTNPKEGDHVVFIYKQNGAYGAVGKSNIPKLEGRPPLFPTVEELALSFWKAFATPTTRIDSFGVARLDKIHAIDWRFSETTLDRIVDYINRVKHYRLNPQHNGKKRR